MNKPKTILSVIALACVLLISSCSKKSDPAPSRTVLLTQNTWKFSSVTTPDPLTTGLLTAVLNGSEYSFKTDGTVSYKTSLASSTSKWEFTSNETKIILNKGATNENTQDVVTLDGSNLELRETDGGVTITIKYVKK